MYKVMKEKSPERAKAINEIDKDLRPFRAMLI